MKMLVFNNIIKAKAMIVIIEIYLVKKPQFLNLKYFELNAYALRII